MEQSNALETVYFVSSAPFASAEEEIATSYIMRDDGETEDEQMEYEVIISEEVVNEIAVGEHVENFIVAVEGNVENDVTVEDIDNCVPLEESTNCVHVEEAENFDPSEERVSQTNVEEPLQKTSGLEQLYAAAKVVPKPNVDKFTCQYCYKRFNKTSNRIRHVRNLHKDMPNTGERSKMIKDYYIKCVECNESFTNVTKLRGHLESNHNMDMPEERLTFPDINAFKQWKCEIERKELCSFTLKQGARPTPDGPKYLYTCHRSGKYAGVRGPRQRMLKTQGSCKLGIVCTAGISCSITPKGVIVKYHPRHYGHGGETSFINLSQEEQNAVEASVSKGVPVENLLNDLRDNTSSKDHFQLYLLEKRDIRWIDSAFNAEEYNPGISDAESVDHWVRLCCQMDNSPILFYRQEESVNNHEEFLLIIMTEYQKHIIQSSSKDIICVDSIYRQKGMRFYLTLLFVMDEDDIAFPAAFCISKKVDGNVILQFFNSISESTGPLSAKYFMSDNESFYFDSWKEVMNDESKWLWSMWYVESKFRMKLRKFRGSPSERGEVYAKMRKLLECQNQSIFTCMFNDFVDSLLSNTDTEELGNFIQHHYSSNHKMWAYCYRRDIKLSTNICLEVMHRTFQYCCSQGRKRRLDKFIFVLMKLVRNKMLDHLSNVLDDEKVALAKETINVCHLMGLEIMAEDISSLDDKIWLIRSENEEENIYVIRENLTCPERCNLKCEDCDICVHMFSCSCYHNMINANLCHHIHAVVWKFLTPHFSPPPSPPVCKDNIESDPVSVVPDINSELLESALKATHDVYRTIQLSKCTLNNDSLSSIIKKLSECVDICSGKKTATDSHIEKTLPSSPSPDSDTVLVNSLRKENASQTLILPYQLENFEQSNHTSHLTSLRQNSEANIIGSAQSVPQYVLIIPPKVS